MLTNNPLKQHAHHACHECDAGLDWSTGSTMYLIEAAAAKAKVLVHRTPLMVVLEHWELPNCRKLRSKRVPSRVMLTASFSNVHCEKQCDRFLDNE